MEIFFDILIAVATLVIPGIACGFLIVLLGVKTAEKRRVKRNNKKTDTDLCAFVRCNGGEHSVKRYTYADACDCNSAHLLAGGPTECRFACLGLGTCAEVCHSGAISINGGVAVVDESTCDGCGKCADVCPRGVIGLIPRSAKVKITCGSLHEEKEIFRICDVGCIGCKRCENNCKYNAIKVSENVACIDYDKCTACGECAKICPQSVIKSSVVEEEFDETEYFEIPSAVTETEESEI